MTDRLKPCPFCGGEVRWKSGSIVCEKCDMKFSYFGASYELTNKRWNTRKPIDRIVEQLEECSVTYCKEYGYAEDENVLYLPDAIEIVKGVQNDR